MKQRSRAGGELTKGRRRKTSERKRRNTPKALQRSNSSVAGEETEIARLTCELNEALEQQAASSDVLRVISGSPAELEPVFDAMLQSATRICDAAFGAMLLRDGDAYRRVALHNAPQKFSEYSNKTPILRPGVAPAVDWAIRTRHVAHISDLKAENPSEPIVKFGGGVLAPF
jgi:hypothetical protein